MNTFLCRYKDVITRRCLNKVNFLSDHLTWRNVDVARFVLFSSVIKFACCNVFRFFSTSPSKKDKEDGLMGY
jgi:hypothetical protein